jgi:hypothetical protein
VSPSGQFCEGPELVFGIWVRFCAFRRQGYAHLRYVSLLWWITKRRHFFSPFDVREIRRQERQALLDWRSIEHHRTFLHTNPTLRIHYQLCCSTSLQISQFAHLPSTSFLCILDESPTTLVGSQNLQISLTDGNRYDNLQGKAQNLVLALKNINSAAWEMDSEEEN